MGSQTGADRGGHEAEFVAWSEAGKNNQPGCRLQPGWLFYASAGLANITDSSP